MALRNLRIRVRRKRHYLPCLRRVTDKRVTMIDLTRAKVNKRIPKNRFKAELLGVDAVTWLYKISPDTADFRHGDEIAEIQIFAVSFKDGAAGRKDIAAVQRDVPYKILFTAHDKWFAVIEGELFESDKRFLDGDALTIERRSAKLTDLYEDIAAVFIPIARRTAESIAGTVTRYKALQMIEREIESLQRKVDNEKQTNKRFEYNEQLKALREEREGLANG